MADVFRTTFSNTFSWTKSILIEIFNGNLFQVSTWSWLNTGSGNDLSPNRWRGNTWAKFGNITGTQKRIPFKEMHWKVSFANVGHFVQASMFYGYRPSKNLHLGILVTMPSVVSFTKDEIVHVYQADGDLRRPHVGVSNHHQLDFVINSLFGLITKKNT